MRMNDITSLIDKRHREKLVLIKKLELKKKIS